MKRRNFIKTSTTMLLATTISGCTKANNSNTTPVPGQEISVTTRPATVYFTWEITPASLIKIYQALGREATGKVGIKLSMGEPGGHNYLKPELVGNLVRMVNGTFIDANTAYGGNRAITELHLKTAEDHGFTAIATIDILDSEGEIHLPIIGGKHLKYDIVGFNFPNYDFTVVLSHFKGHMMGGFGGALKNISIGIASSAGKTYIHSAGESTTSWGNPEQDDFLESMAEAAKAIAEYCGDNILYINVTNNLSVDCDCDSNPADPEMSDIGILASFDPVALDKACVDQVYASTDHGKIHLIERMESRNGIHTVVYAEQIGIGTQQYQLVSID
ncbi:MAG: DUF362 domain-containing protein [Tannerellaceae bacterium]|nr:DUF362 domain-containing protein [Tannerellaceae bacterium]